MPTELEEKTREIFHKIHTSHLETEDAAVRVRNLLNTESMQLPEDYFRDKVCADLGCGSSVSGTYNLLKLGAKFVHAMDLTDNFIRSATEVLSGEPDFEGRWQLDVGSLEHLPYENEYFDFILCQGVIHHVDDDRKALKEIFRLLKKGGMANLMVHGKGGLLTRFVMEVLRDEYQNNRDVARMINEDLSAETIAKQIKWLKERVDDDGTKTYRLCMTLLDCLRELLNEDFVLTVKDRVQAPLYRMYTEEGFGEMLKEAGFTSWYRISRKPIYRNVRKILAPLYYEYRSPLSRLLYGEGMIILMVKK